MTTAPIIKKDAPVPQSALPFIKREDSWAIFIALGLTLLVTVAYLGNFIGIFKSMAVSVPSWSNDLSKAAGALSKNFMGIVTLFVFFGATFTYGAKVMGYNVERYIKGFTVLFLLSLLITFLGSNKFLKTYQLETPILALVFGMVVSNTMTLPAWFKEALRTEYYVKTGIILMGATLPFTIIMSAGPLSMLQAGIVSITTFLSIYWAATRLFGLDPRFGAALGAGGSICGVSMKAGLLQHQ
jgi:hypothetical protein